ncbi:transposase [Streptomyces sp. SCA3-4]|uniref:transposase n=1 Tax=Streptomyces sichuanensis TaxID=2871810 RepID=UPI001CE2A8E3|nr:transposase [Streptomyces sichuanensis]MCA6092053.1 transposase [Streptomyces sichuanensis]
MGRGDLSDREWARPEPHLPKNTGRGGRWACHRKVINGISFRLRTGVPWRDLPAHSSRRNRRYLRRRQMRHMIPERRDQRADRQRSGSRGGRPTGFDQARYARRNEVERTVDGLKGFRAVATRYDKRAYVFHGMVTLAEIRSWLRG